MSEAIYCLSCGYDLRGSAFGECPECGRSFDRRNPRTFARSLYDVWPTSDFKFVLISEIVSLTIFFGIGFVASGGLDVIGNIAAIIGCFALIAVLIFRCFLLFYSWIALLTRFRYVPPEKRMLFTVVMLAPTVVTAAFWLWIELTG